MFDVTGNRAISRGLQLVMFAMLAIVAIKVFQMVLGWLGVRELVPVVGDYSLITWLDILLLGPLMIVATVVVVLGCWFGFKGTSYVWAKRFANFAMAAFAVSVLLKLLSLGLHFVMIESLWAINPGAKGTGIFVIGTGLYLYYLLALDAGDSFPAGVDSRGGRVLLVPIAPIAVGTIICFVEFGHFNIASWVTIAAAGLTAYSTYNRIPPDDALEPAKEMPPMNEMKPPVA